ncbi:MAG TPA: oligosaccharide flippase family protein [Actinomycetota bacterium]|nr:oligosaccharide flippase family protein [Actinomycetota bacterium]
MSARISRSDRQPVISNLAARIIALVALAIATVIVARTGGAKAVGVFSLLRVLPWLAGAIASQGVVGAAPYFLSGPTRRDRNVGPTLLAMAIVSGLVAAAIWAIAAPWIEDLFFKSVSVAAVAAAGSLVLTQLMESTAKACAQGTGDMTGANRVIVFEEVLYLPIYVFLLWVGLGQIKAMVAALAAGDVINASVAWARLARRGLLAGGGKPNVSLAARIARYGISAQVGSLLMLLNERLDFAIVAAIVGPAALGVYAVASKLAELLRVPTTAVQYVLYPQYSRVGGEEAAKRARKMLRRAGWIPIALAFPLAAGAFALPLVYGGQFRSAIVPTLILLGGLAGAGVSSVVTAFLFADGRPGLNSIAAGAGVVVTISLDLVLIPRLGVKGAAIASTVAYLTTSAAHLWFFRVATRSHGARAPEAPPLAEVTS